MRAVIQRVVSASVMLGGAGQRRAIGPGMMTLVGVAPADTEAEARWLAEKLVGLRIFADADGRMNRGLLDVPNGAMLIVSQFTLLGETRKGRRPSYAGAAGPEIARPVYEAFVRCVRERGVPTETGEFGADMRVELVNDGPVTLVVDTPL